MQNNIELNGQRIEYELKTYRFSKTIKIMIRRDATILVTGPLRVTRRIVEGFIRRKADWIITNLERCRKNLGSRPNRAQNKLTQRKEYLEYKEKARALVNERIEYFNRFYKFSFKKISIRNQSTRWGSCSRKGNLNFNYKLALLDPKLADYIIVHELCHLKEFNHSPQFWALVERTIPDYKERRRQLRTSGSQLSPACR